MRAHVVGRGVREAYMFPRILRRDRLGPRFREGFNTPLQQLINEPLIRTAVIVRHIFKSILKKYGMELISCWTYERF